LGFAVPATAQTLDARIADAKRAAAAADKSATVILQ
jgi:hypothetical protein